MEILQFFRLISRTFLLLAKILMIFVCLHYILHFQTYSITANIPKGFRNFAMIDKPLILFESIGMLFLVIPLTIIIVSLYHPKKTWLQIMANLMSVGGNAFSLGHLASKGLLEDYFRTFLVTIYNAPSLENKIKLFSDLFNKAINLYVNKVNNVMDFQNFVQGKYNDNFSSYREILTRLPELDIMSFASRTAEELYNAYLIHLNPITTTTMTTQTSPTSDKGIYVWVIGGFAIIAYFLYKYGDFIKNLSYNMVCFGKIQTKTVNEIRGTDQHLTTTNENIASLGQSVSNNATNIDHLHKDHVALKLIVENNANVATKSVVELNQLYEELKIMVEKGNYRMTSSELRQALPTSIITLEDQIKALAKNGLDTNNGLVNLIKQIDGIKLEMKQLIEERNITSLVTTTRENELLYAAQHRLTNELMEKMQAFDINSSITKVKNTIKDYVTSQVALFETHLTEHIDTCNKTLQNNKQTLDRKLLELQDQVKDNKNALGKLESETMTVTSKLEHNDRLQTTVNGNTFSDIEQLKSSLSNMQNECNKLKKAQNELEAKHLLEQENVKSLGNMTKENSITFETALNQHVAEFIRFKEEMLLKLSRGREQAIGVMTTARDLMSDNQRIQHSTYRPFMRSAIFDSSNNNSSSNSNTNNSGSTE